MTHAQLSPVAPVLHDTSSAILRRSCGCGGSCGSCSEEKREKTVQRKANGSSSQGRSFAGVPATRAIDVRVGPSDDAFEREADRVADAVTGGGHAEPPSFAPPRVQRQIEDEEGEDAAAEDEGEGESEGDESGRPSFEPGASHAGGRARVPVGSSGGSPLPSPVRAPLESSMGHDFNSVRVHTGADAARATASVNARAFTVGSDIYFSPGRYEPQSKAGRHLLAHELTHVMQQSRGGSRVQRKEEKKASPAPKKAAAKPKGKKSDRKPCAKDPSCEGCAKQHNEFAVHPDCKNESCGGSAAINPKMFIRHLFVNRAKRGVVAILSDGTKDTHILKFESTPNPSTTPKGLTSVGIKCGACHTNMHGSGMGWFTSFRNGTEYGIHNSQPVNEKYQSLGCVRVKPCSCAKYIHDNTTSGKTKVCIHDGDFCKQQVPKSGKFVERVSCGDLHMIRPPASVPSPAPGKGVPPPAQKPPAVASAEAERDEDETSQEVVA